MTCIVTRNVTNNVTKYKYNSTINDTKFRSDTSHTKIDINIEMISINYKKIRINQLEIILSTNLSF